MAANLPDGWLRRPDADTSLACPECDRAAQCYKRMDGSIRCHACGAEFPPEEIVKREDRRGSNLTPELRAKGARNGPGMQEGTAQGPREMEVRKE